jgi:hypothetical protein
MALSKFIEIIVLIIVTALFEGILTFAAISHFLTGKRGIVFYAHGKNVIFIHTQPFS